MLYNKESVLCFLNYFSFDCHSRFYSFSNLNYILFFLILTISVIICFVFLLRHALPGNSNLITGFENTFVLCVLLLSTVLLVFSVTEPSTNVSSVWLANDFTANKIFLILFLLTVPVTFTLLVRQEQITTVFVGLNFLFLLLVVFFLINTESLIGMVMGYELVFLPSFLIMRKTIYSASAQSAYSVFTVWSVLGSLVVVGAAIFLVVKTGEHSFFDIKIALQSWANNELFILSLLFFIGFGVKIPIWPFHYWLTRVHVESSTGFSIFLSGFLVKAAVFVCWKVVAGLGIVTTHPFFILLCLFSVLDGALKLTTQTDVKKMVAFATVFEMGLIYLFLLWRPGQSYTYIFAFCFAHAFLSGLMFYLVDLVYTRTKTRSVDMLSGLVVYFPNLVKVVWLMLFIFWGLPFTVKFSIELWVLINFVKTGSLFLFALIVFILAFANIFVTKTWVHIAYGSPTSKNLSYDLNTWEFFFAGYLIFFSTVPAIVFTNLEF